MKKRILLALDLEGVNYVVGEPYKGLFAGSEQWDVARRQAVKEINAAADALFRAGAEVVALWDNHSGGGNVIAEDLDGRITLLNPDLSKPRMYFADGKYDVICFFGYHAMEGTYGGVLAHTMNSTTVQYYKINGKYVGEVDIDGYIAASHDIPTCFFCGGDIACAQAKRALPDIVTVTTKTEQGRNKAVFRENEQLLSEIAEKIVLAVTKDVKPSKLEFPCVMEKSLKRVEDAERYLQRYRSYGLDADHLEDEVLGKDGHTIVVRLQTAEEFAKSV